MMRHIFFTALVLCLLSTLSFAAEPQLNETGAAFLKAIRANDLEAVVALYAPDAEVFPPDAMVARGTEQIRKNYEGLLNAYTIQQFDVIEAEYQTIGDISFGGGLFRLTMAPKAGGAAVTMEGRFSDVSKKINGKWLYIIDHASVPLAPPAQTQQH